MKQKHFRYRHLPAWLWPSSQCPWTRGPRAATSDPAGVNPPPGHGSFLWDELVEEGGKSSQSLAAPAGCPTEYQQHSRYPPISIMLSPDSWCSSDLLKPQFPELQHFARISVFSHLFFPLFSPFLQHTFTALALNEKSLRM